METLNNLPISSILSNQNLNDSQYSVILRSGETNFIDPSTTIKQLDDTFPFDHEDILLFLHNQERVFPKQTNAYLFESLLTKFLDNSNSSNFVHPNDSEKDKKLKQLYNKYVKEIYEILDLDESQFNPYENIEIKFVHSHHQEILRSIDTNTKGVCLCGCKHVVKGESYDLAFVVNGILVGIDLSDPLFVTLDRIIKECCIAPWRIMEVFVAYHEVYKTYYRTYKNNVYYSHGSLDIKLNKNVDNFLFEEYELNIGLNIDELDAFLSQMKNLYLSFKERPTSQINKQVFSSSDLKHLQNALSQFGSSTTTLSSGNYNTHNDDEDDTKRYNFPILENSPYTTTQYKSPFKQVPPPSDDNYYQCMKKISEMKDFQTVESVFGEKCCCTRETHSFAFSASTFQTVDSNNSLIEIQFGETIGSLKKRIGKRWQESFMFLLNQHLLFPNDSCSFIFTSFQFYTLDMKSMEQTMNIIDEIIQRMVIVSNQKLNIVPPKVEFVCEDERIIRTIKYDTDGVCSCGHKHQIGSKEYDLVFLVNDKLFGINILEPLIVTYKRICQLLNIDLAFIMYVHQAFMEIMQLLGKVTQEIGFGHGKYDPTNVYENPFFDLYNYLDEYPKRSRHYSLIEFYCKGQLKVKHNFTNPGKIDIYSMAVDEEAKEEYEREREERLSMPINNNNIMYYQFNENENSDDEIEKEEVDNISDKESVDPYDGLTVIKKYLSCPYTTLFKKCQCNIDYHGENNHKTNEINEFHVLYNQHGNMILLQRQKTFKQLIDLYGNEMGNYYIHLLNFYRIFPKNYCSLLLNVFETQVTTHEKNDIHIFKNLCEDMWKITHDKDWEPNPMIHKKYASYPILDNKYIDSSSESEDNPLSDSSTDSENDLPSISNDSKTTKKQKKESKTVPILDNCYHNPVEFITEDPQLVETIIEKEGPCLCGHKHLVNGKEYDIVMLVGEKIVGINVKDTIVRQCASMCEQLGIRDGYSIFMLCGLIEVFNKMSKQKLNQRYYHGGVCPYNMTTIGAVKKTLLFNFDSYINNIEENVNTMIVAFLKKYDSLRMKYFLL